MFCYDERFFWRPSSGDIACRDAGLHRFAVHVRQAVALCFVGHEPAFRFATVIIFWIAVEVFDRIHLLNGLWANPQGHVQEIALILVSFAVTGLYLACDRRKKTADVKRQ